MADLKTNTERREGEATLSIICEKTGARLVSLYRFNTGKYEPFLYGGIETDEETLDSVLAAMVVLEEFRASMNN